jgi:hypothetical protein
VEKDFQSFAAFQLRLFNEFLVYADATSCHEVVTSSAFKAFMSIYHGLWCFTSRKKHTWYNYSLWTCSCHSSEHDFVAIYYGRLLASWPAITLDCRL